MTHQWSCLQARGKSRDTQRLQSSFHTHTGTWHSGKVYPNIPDETETREIPDKDE